MFKRSVQRNFCVSTDLFYRSLNSPKQFKLHRYSAFHLCHQHYIKHKTSQALMQVHFPCLIQYTSLDI